MQTLLIRIRVIVLATLAAFAITAVFAAIGFVLWEGGHRVLNGEMTAGSLSAFVFYSVAVSGAVANLSEAVAAFSPGILHPPALKNPSENSCSHVLPVHLRGHAGIVKKLTETFSEGQQ